MTYLTYLLNPTCDITAHVNNSLGKYTPALLNQNLVYFSDYESDILDSWDIYHFLVEWPPVCSFCCLSVLSVHLLLYFITIFSVFHFMDLFLSPLLHLCFSSLLSVAHPPLCLWWLHLNMPIHWYLSNFLFAICWLASQWFKQTASALSRSLTVCHLNKRMTKNPISHSCPIFFPQQTL